MEASMTVRIEALKPMRVASVRVKSANPETDAWLKIKKWAESRNLLIDLDRHPVFGYTCQLPGENEKEYGYEFCIAVDSETEIAGDVKEQLLAGGLFAVATHRGPPSPEVWKSLWDWVQASPYKWRKTHELERPVNPSAPETDWIFELYLPVEPKGQVADKA